MAPGGSKRSYYGMLLFAVPGSTAGEGWGPDQGGSSSLVRPCGPSRVSTQERQSSAPSDSPSSQNRPLAWFWRHLAQRETKSDVIIHKDIYHIYIVWNMSAEIGSPREAFPSKLASPDLKDAVCVDNPVHEQLQPDDTNGEHVSEQVRCHISC